jgi:hypothetical protein
MHRMGKLRLDKSIEIVGLDIAELGGVSEEVYNKIKLEFGRGINSPKINGTGILEYSNTDLMSP